MSKKTTLAITGAIGALSIAGLLYLLTKKGRKTGTLKRRTEILAVKKQFPETEYNKDEIIHLKDAENLEEKIFRLRAGGVDNLQFIVDFDQTLSSFNYNNEVCQSCFRMFQRCKFVSPELVAQLQANVQKYMPIEHDPSIPREEKLKHLEEWWKAEEKMMASLKLNEEKLVQILEEANFAFRYGVGNFLKLVEHAQLPIYIVSGGILEFMQATLKQYIDVQNMKVKLFGNVMLFDEKGHFNSFETPHLNSLHKETILSKQNTEAKLRKNAILIGDTINDRFLTSGLALDVVLSIGFLKPENIQSLDQYKEAYDIVIVGDGNFTQIEALTREILNIPMRSALRKLMEKSESPLNAFISLE